MGSIDFVSWSVKGNAKKEVAFIASKVTDKLEGGQFQQMEKKDAEYWSSVVRRTLVDVFFELSDELLLEVRPGALGP